jgi:subtilisin family serine protease
MAAPHVAGVTALLLSRNRNLTYAQVSNALTSTTMKNVNPTGRNCGGVNESNYPNNAAGAGVVNAQGALQNVISGRF